MHAHLGHAREKGEQVRRLTGMKRTAVAGAECQHGGGDAVDLGHLHLLFDSVRRHGGIARRQPQADDLPGEGDRLVEGVGLRGAALQCFQLGGELRHLPQCLQRHFGDVVRDAPDGDLGQGASLQGFRTSAPRRQSSP